MPRRRRPTVRTLRLASLLALRRLTAGARRGPEFLIIGPRKCGTTSLFRYLEDHPRVVLPVRKEINYFSWHAHRPLAWYLAHFPRRGPGVLSGEASPTYFANDAVPARVRAVLPGVRLLVPLRNPVERAYSNYWHNRTRGSEDRPFAAVLDQELGGPNAAEGRRRQHVAKGCYAEPLARWLEVFPAEQVLVLDSGHLFREPAAAMAEAFRFVGLEPHRSAEYRTWTRGHYGEPLAPIERARLQEHYRPHNERLFALLGRRFDWE